jgi:hypothetical protein
MCNVHVHACIYLRLSAVNLFQSLLGHLFQGHLAALDVLGRGENGGPVLEHSKGNTLTLAVSDEVYGAGCQ